MCNTTTAFHKGVDAMTMNRLKQAVGHTKDVANLPPRLLEMYSEFITKNAGAVGQVEGALRSLTYIIPGISSA
jgi:peroxin-16